MQRHPYLSQTVLDGLELARRRHFEEIAAIDALITRTDPTPATQVGVRGRKQTRSTQRASHSAAGKGATKPAATPTPATPTGEPAAAQRGVKRQVSAAGKKRIQAALKKRWAKFHTEKAAAAGV
jgi:hypothetical protein